MLNSRIDVFSIATVRECSRSSVVIRAAPDGSLTPDSSLICTHAVQPTTLERKASVTLCPSVLENTLKDVNPDEAGQSCMQVSFHIHLQDPVHSLPHVVDVSSDSD